MNRTADTLTFCEIWRPSWMSGCPAFWRELTPTPTPPNHAARLSFTPGPWRMMDPRFAKALAQLPNSYFTLDDYPGITFCRRWFKDKQATEADRAAIRKLWREGNPEAATPPCPNCGGTGRDRTNEVVSSRGNYYANCDCEAGRALELNQPWPNT